jgi:hypothetical protein
MKARVGDFVKVIIESGYEDVGLVMKAKYKIGHAGREAVYEIRCQKSQTDCIATQDMIEVLSSRT